MRGPALAWVARSWRGRVLSRRGLPNVAHRGATGQRHYNCLSSKRVQRLPPHSGASIPSRQVAQNQLDYRLKHQLPWMRPYDSGDYLTPAVGLATNR